MKRIVSLFIVLAILACVVSGCKKMPGVDPDVQPELCFSHYKELTDLYGTSKWDTLKAFGIDQQEITNYGPDRYGIPRTEEYAGINFDITLMFGKESHFCSVDYQAAYQFPEDEMKLLEDIVTISKQLISDLGEASDTSFVFNWAEVYLDQKWDRDIAYWQDISVLKRLMDEGFQGTLLRWNLTPVASEPVKAELEKYHGDEDLHSLSFSVMFNENDNTAILDILY